MQLQELIYKTSLSALKTSEGALDITGIAIDSRLVQSGNLFVAVRGSEMDGLDYAEAAIEAGAIAILIEEGEEGKALNICQQVPVLTCPNIRQAAAQLASIFYAQQPEHCVAITGTNGKTSTVSFLRQLWSLLGHSAASLGTLGFEVAGIESPFPKSRNSLTTPDVITLHDRLQTLKNRGVDYVAFEASSHGLDQHRLDGVKVQVAAFTNFSQDHLDYHHSLDAYFQAKLRLFSECLDPAGVAVINLRDSKGPSVLSACQARGVKTLTIGSETADLHLKETQADREGQLITFAYNGQDHRFMLPLPGSYQVENIMVAIAVLLAQDFDLLSILSACEKLKPIPGRLEPAAPGVYVDYAHTPEALRSAIKAIPHNPGHLWIVFGCGGDRDPDKRAIMGQVVSDPEFEGKVIITDDNPRTEDPAHIRREIIKGCPQAWNIGSRRHAIQAVMTLKEPGDKVLIAGKGHENYQIIGKEVDDFDDREEVRRALPLWLSHDAEKATGGQSTASWKAMGVSIDTRTLQPGDLFVALDGENSDGHDYLSKAFEMGAAAAIVSRNISAEGPLLIVRDTVNALEDLGEFARDRATQAKRIAITGSVGKTSTKEMLKLGLSSLGLTHASVASYNNHWGVPLTLARMPQDAEYAIFEIGMNHPNEITPLSKLVQPHVAVITTVAASHLGHFDSVRGIARAKAEIFDGLVKGGTVILNGDNEYFADLDGWAQGAGIKNILEVSRRQTADARISSDASKVDLADQSYPLEVQKYGVHLAENAAMCLLIARSVSADVTVVNANISRFHPVSGRGDSHEVMGSNLSFTLIDESYNANPASMAAALKVLGSYKGARKIAVIGDMRELGDESAELHQALAEPIIENGIDKVFCCGPYMVGLYEKLSSGVKAGYTEASTDLIPLIKAGLQEGDVVMVKGSFGTKMKPIVQALLDLNNETSAKAVN